MVETEHNDPHSPSSSDEEPQWTTAHDIVGKRVVAYFAVPAAAAVDHHESSSSSSTIPSSMSMPGGERLVNKPFGGHVTQYSPPSRPGKTDQLYHIVWDDGVRYVRWMMDTYMHGWMDGR